MGKNSFSLSFRFILYVGMFYLFFPGFTFSAASLVRSRL
jgi:hypothetical protein